MYILACKMLVLKDSGCCGLGDSSIHGLSLQARPTVAWSSCLLQNKKKNRPQLVGVRASARVIQLPYQKPILSPSSAQNRRLRQKRSSADTILDGRGLISNPRSARELAFSILYSGLLSGEKPSRIFNQRLKQAPPGDFSKSLLRNYKYTTEDEDYLFVEDARTAKKLETIQEEESSLEAAVLSAPLSLVYSKSVLKLAQEIIEVTMASWRKQEDILKDLLPERWQEPGNAAAVQKCILHMAMAEMTKMGTSPKIAVNEAVELGKRYSYGRAYRIINGCLGKFTKSAYFLESQQVNKAEIPHEAGRSEVPNEEASSEAPKEETRSEVPNEDGIFVSGSHSSEE